MRDRDLALHGLAIKKLGGADAAAARIGPTPAVGRVRFVEAAATGRAVKAGDRFVLTPSAQVALRMACGRDFAVQRADAAMGAAYEEFERINESLKTLITEWQTITVGGRAIPNDHSDRDRDARIIDRLGRLHERAEPMLRRLAAGLPRLAAYRRLLEAALERAEDGAVEWVSDARIASYHTVWFELHEDLIRVLGRVRAE